MVKLTVLYNLPEDADHDEFIKWRTGPHQEENASSPNVLKTDFYRTKATVLGEPAFEYVTEAYFETMEKLEASLFNEESLAKLKEDSKRGKDFIFLVSEELASTDNR
mgnify:CR=1 FL=1